MITTFEQLLPNFKADVPGWANWVSVILTATGVSCLSVWNWWRARRNETTMRRQLAADVGTAFSETLSTLRLVIDPTTVEPASLEALQKLSAIARAKPGLKSRTIRTEGPPGPWLGLSGAYLFRLIAITFWILSATEVFSWFGDNGVKYSIMSCINALAAISLVQIVTMLSAIAQNMREARALGDHIGELFENPTRLEDRFSTRRVARRVTLIVDNLDDLPALHELLPAASALDSEDSDGSYIPLSTYAWTLPVLGFIGTAQGIAQSVSAFGSGISKNAGDGVPDLAGSYLRIVDGLSSAFDTSVMALAQVVVVYVCMRALRTLDNRALAVLDDISLGLLARIPLPAEAYAPDGVTRAVEKLESIAGRLAWTPSNAGGMTDPRQDHQAFPPQLEPAIAQFVTSLPQLSATFDRVAQRFSDDLDHMERLRKDADAAVGRLQNAVGGITGAAASVAEARNGLLETASSAAQSASAVGKLVSQWTSEQSARRMNQGWPMAMNVSLSYDPSQLSPGAEDAAPKQAPAKRAGAEGARRRA